MEFRRSCITSYLSRGIPLKRVPKVTISRMRREQRPGHVASPICRMRLQECTRDPFHPTALTSNVFGMWEWLVQQSHDMSEACVSERNLLTYNASAGDKHLRSEVMLRMST